jgi:putative addiction module killer protein
MERKVFYYKRYFIDFFLSLEKDAQRKIAYVIDVLKTQQRPGANFVKHVREGVYELRAQHEGNIYRAFFIFDEGNIVMLFNGFQKKTQNPPEKEIEKAIKLKDEYYAGK